MPKKRGVSHSAGWCRQEKRVAVYLRDQFTCMYCWCDLHDAWESAGKVAGDGKMLSIDHLRGRDDHEPTNIVTCCLDCNQEKGGKNWLKFIYEKRRDHWREEQDVVEHFIRRNVRRKLNIPLAKALIRDRQRHDVIAAEGIDEA